MIRREPVQEIDHGTGLLGQGAIAAIAKDREQVPRPRGEVAVARRAHDALNGPTQVYVRINHVTNSKSVGCLGASELLGSMKSRGPPLPRPAAALLAALCLT